MIKRFMILSTILMMLRNALMNVLRVLAMNITSDEKCVSFIGYILLTKSQ
jgi:hypothetical protein